MAAEGSRCERIAFGDLGVQRKLEKFRGQDQRAIKSLKKELQRKEKALAEAAALLLVTKLCRHFRERPS